MSNLLRLILLRSLQLMALFSPATFAHHGTFTFDGDITLTLEGKVVRFNWTNPHSSVVLAVANAEGGLTEYLLEADGPSILSPLGVSQNSLKIGDQVIAYVSPSRAEQSDSNRSPVVLGREIIKEDGSVIGLSVAYTRRLARDNSPTTDSVLTTWVPDQRALFEFVPTTDNWSLTEEGEASRAAYNTQAMFPQSECIPATSPTLMMYPTAKAFSQTGNIIYLNADWMGAVRTIYMDGRAHPATSEYSLLGHSLGHWEGSTLVVDTTNYSDNSIGIAFGITSGINKHLQERFEVDENGRTLTYSFELEDSDYLSGSVSGSYQWHFRPDIAVSTVACDPEVAARYLNE